MLYKSDHMEQETVDHLVASVYPLYCKFNVNQVVGPPLIIQYTYTLVGYAVA